MVPNHILILGSPNTGKIRLAKIIAPHESLEIDAESHSGVIVKSQISTKYYSMSLSILIDEYPEKRSNPQDEDAKYKSFKTWMNEFLSSDYDELREALGGFIFALNIDEDSSEYIERCLGELNEIRTKLGSDDNEWGGFFVITGISDRAIIPNDIEDLAINFGMEFVNLNESGQNEFRDKLGKDRLIEIIETHEWKHIEPDSDSIFKEHKRNRMDEMTTGLLEIEDENSACEAQKDLSEILQRLKIAKSEIEQLNEEQKKDYIDKTIEEIMNYI